MGFMSLNNGRSDRSDRSDTLGEGDIPLAQVNTSSSTGARRHNQTLPDMSPEPSQSVEEKSGLFHRKSKNSGVAPPGGRRKMVTPLKDQGRKGTFGEEGGLNAMGRLYNKIIGFSVITRYLVYIAPVAIILAVPLIVIPITGNYNESRVGGSVADGAPKLFDLFLWIEISWLCLWGGKIVSHFLPHAFMFLCGVVSVGTRKYATVLKSLEIPFSLFFWALASWLVFRFKFGSDDKFEWVYVIVRILGSLFVSSCVFLGEKAIIQLVSITYHQRSFANRIKDSKREIYLLGLMFEASRTLFPMYCREFAEEDYIINDSIEMMLGRKNRHGRGHKKSGSVTPLNLIGEAAGGIGRVGGKITSVFGNFASEITGKQVFNPNSSHSVVLEALEKLQTSEALARRIWMSFVVEGKDALYQEDVIEVLGPALKEEAEECFEAVDADQNGDISLDEMVRKVVEVGKERKAIGNSMKDIGQALAVLDSILLFCVVLIVVFIFLSFFNSSFVTTLASAGTALLSLSFAFSVTCQEFLGSCIFLFVKHPYDVGDRVDISDEQLIVEKISLLYTVFTRIDNMKIVQTPNIIVNNLWIENVTRSKAMKETIELNISFDTSFEDIELLRLEMEKFVRHPDNARDFQPDFSIGIGSVNNCDKLTLQIVVKHKSNWHNETVRATRRSKFICALALACKKIPIYGPGGGGETLGGPNNPTYSVSVDDGFASKAREKAAAATDAGRLVPKIAKDGDTPAAQQKNEQEAVSELTAKPPLADMDNNFGYNRDALEERTDSNSTALNSRDGSTERLRTDNIETMRQDLLKRASTRGRRKAGDGVSAVSLNESSPGLMVTQYDGDSQATIRSQRQRSFDVESQTGVMGSPYNTGLGVTGSSGYGHGPAVSPSVAAAASQSYSIYHQSSNYSTPGPSNITGEPAPQVSLPPSVVTTGPDVPLQTSQEERALSPPVYGARRRGASVSQALEEREREEEERTQHQG
ncbi:hypothetical protein VP1G_00590 [Cytospora mali]|uniref:Mechanosensitive ion channel protein n=1 Tax=Cytospora mali TaxID=578113 RepID=A0A194UNY5_CYTMA|nr:hypothetical protein VP1G_00590 [Valsa mali var. pyri (nom. inval.)]